jgi:1,4-alpha-glucan branching enzyme
MSIKKQYVEKKSKCKVTFKLDKNTSLKATFVNLAGDFNDWDPVTIPMKKLKTGEYYTTLDLDAGKEYQFRYFVDGQWINEMEADKFVLNEYQTENSVVIL